MRRSVFLAVLLSLVLSLSKGEDNQEPETTPTSSTTPGQTTEKPEATPPPTNATTPAPTNATTPGQTTEKPEATPPPTNATTPGQTTEKPEATPAPTNATTPAPTNATTPGQTTEKPEATPAPTNATTPGQTTEKPEATPAPTNATIPAGNFCYPDPCGASLAQCLSLNSNYSCQCPYGFYYSEKDCHTGKTLSGFITLKEKYSEDVHNISSVEYEKVFQKIQDFFRNALKSLGLEQTVIVKIQPQDTYKASDFINVTVTNLFVKTSHVDKEKVSDAITKAIDDNPSYVFKYNATTNCVAFDCDLRTTECTGEEPPECVCKKDFSKTKWDVRSCSGCSENCSSLENEYCAIEKEVPACKCLPNFQREGEICVACPVGYSGENCNDNTELSLIIVGTVLGAVILILVIVVSVISVRAKHKNDPEKRSLIKQGYSNYEDGQTTVFPRVQTTSGHANAGYQPNNPYEMRSTNRGQFPERDYEVSYDLSGEPEGFRMPRRY